MENIITAIKEAALSANREADNQSDWDSKAFFTGKREAFAEVLEILEDYANGKDAEAVRKAIEQIQEA